MMEVEVTVILDLPEMQRDLLPELPAPVRLKRDTSIMTLALFLEATQKETPPGEVRHPAGRRRRTMSDQEQVASDGRSFQNADYLGGRVCEGLLNLGIFEVVQKSPLAQV